jgi:hypothetical protein
MEMRARRAVVALLWSLWACAEDPAPATELIVVVDSDLLVPSELDEINLQARGPGDRMQFASAALGADQAALPRTLALRHLGGALGPIVVEIEGRHAGESVVARAAQVSFIAGRSLVLPLHLARSCLTLRCDGDEACTEGGCQDVVIDASRLEGWTGDRPVLRPHDAGGLDDAGVLDTGLEDDAAALEGGTPDSDVAQEAGESDAPACFPRTELCNNLDDNCNGQADDGFDLSTDVLNCGRCGNRCNTQRGDVCCRGSCARSCQ